MNNANNSANNNSDDDYVTKKTPSFEESALNFINSIRGHIDDNYKHQYFIRKWFFTIFLAMIFISLSPVIGIIWAILTAIFWRYAFWSYQGGLVDRFVNGLMVFGTIGEIINKMIIQWLLVNCWITLIAPLSGIKTWIQAVRADKVLYIPNERRDRWNR